MFFRIFGIVLIGVCSVICLRSIMPSMALLVSSGCCVIIAGMLMSRAGGVIGYCYELCMITGYGEYFNVLLKGLGISLLTQAGAEFCRDNNASTLASRLEFAGKLEILIISMPLIKSIIEVSYNILSE